MNMLKNKWTWFVVAFFVFIVFVSALAQPNLQTSFTNTNQQSPAHNLAVIESGSPNPPASLVSIFEKLLANLHQKCPDESESIISDYIVTGKQIIAKNGKQETLLDFGLGLAASFPDNLPLSPGACAEHAGLLVALVTANKTN